MWVYCGYGHWQEFPDDSPRAIAYQKSIEGMPEAHRKARADHFRKWYMKRERFMAERDMLDFHMVTFEQPVVDLYKMTHRTYHDWLLEAEDRDECIIPQMVALDQIIPTQEEVNQELVNWYRRTGYTLDPKNRPPLALRFLGDEHVYLINGHHRFKCTLDFANGTHSTMYVHVDHIGMTFDAACKSPEAMPIDVIKLFELLFEVA